MKWVFYLALLWAMLVSCSPQATPSPGSLEVSGSPVTPALLSTSEDIFEVEAWVDNPTPDRDARVAISGSLIKHGVRLGGLMMQATWPDEAQERGLPNCYVLVIYGSGVCSVEARDYPPGVFVPITVTFSYEGSTFTGHTGFTPR